MTRKNTDQLIKEVELAETRLGVALIKFALATSVREVWERYPHHCDLLFIDEACLLRMMEYYSDEE